MRGCHIGCCCWCEPSTSSDVICAKVSCALGVCVFADGVKRILCVMWVLSSTRGPEDFACVLAALNVAEECVNCFCSSIGCPTLPL